MPKPMAGIGQQSRRPVAPIFDDARKDLSTPSSRREVSLDRLDLGAVWRKLCGGFLDLRLVGGDDQIIAFVAAHFGEFEADAGRCAGDDGERPICSCHD